MFENPRRGRQATKFYNKCSERNSRSQIVFRTDIFQKFRLGAPDTLVFSKLSLLFYVSFHFSPTNYIFSYVLYMNYPLLKSLYQPLYALLLAATGQFFYLKQYSKLGATLRRQNFCHLNSIFILYFLLNDTLPRFVFTKF